MALKKSFSHSISGTDLIIGAKSGDVQLLMTTVFRKGTPIANVSWNNFINIQQLPQVKWAVPISLGDSHRGYPVLGTSTDYFKHIKYGRKKQLEFESGTPFKRHLDVVLGASVASHLDYSLNHRLYITHGRSKTNGIIHKQSQFKVVGILKPTNTPIDNTLIISVEGMTALHQPNTKIESLVPRSVTGGFIGLKSKLSIFYIQQKINEWKDEALMAIIPGVTLSKLWSTLSTLDAAFFVITITVAIIAFIGLLLSLFISINQRQRELTILRSLGAQPMQLASMLMMESIIITSAGILFGLVLLLSVSQPLSQLIEARLGLILTFGITSFDAIFIASMMGFGLFTSLIPAGIIYRKSLSEGLISNDY